MIGFIKRLLNPSEMYKLTICNLMQGKSVIRLLIILDTEQ